MSSSNLPENELCICEEIERKKKEIKVCKVCIDAVHKLVVPYIKPSKVIQ